MRTTRTIALALVLAAFAAPAAQAADSAIERVILQEQAQGNHASGLGAADAAAEHALAVRSEALNREYGLGTAGAEDALAARSEALNQEYGLGTSQSLGERIIAQERGRHDDANVVGATPAPVQVVGPADGFDLTDAGIGGAAGLAFALLVAAGVAFRGSVRRRGLGSAAPADS